MSLAESLDPDIVLLDLRVPCAKGMVALTEGGTAEREREVLVHIARGGPNREIAGVPVASGKTVRTHIGNLLMKSGARDRTQEAPYAVRHGGGPVGTPGMTG